MLQLVKPGQPALPVVTSADYEPLGPLAELVLANGVTEVHDHDDRYRPDRITASTLSTTLLDWDYTLDAVGNVEQIVVAGVPENMVYGYQDPQYYLTSAEGRWGDPLSWTYDRIGNRLSETRGTTTTTYTYPVNGAGGNAPRLGQAGSEVYGHDAAGNVTSIAGTTTLGLGYDDEGRLESISRSGESASLFYDGRSFLGYSERTIKADHWAIQPIYGSEGTIYRLARQLNPKGPVWLGSIYDVLYFAGRPVAIYEHGPQTTPVLTFYTTDHLGTPALVTDASGVALWEGGFEPFGADWGGAWTKAEAFLRLPGQWDELTWQSDGLESGLYYNVQRWYSTNFGRYISPEPVRWLQHSTHYLYGQNRPTFLIDPRGLAPCAGLTKPGPGSCCDEGDKPLAPTFRNLMARRSLYCANKDKPPITSPQGEKKGWVEVPEQGPPTAHYKPQGNPCIDWCICDHENFHITQALSGELREISHNAAECKAYIRHLRCIVDLTAVGPFVTATGSL